MNKSIIKKTFLEEALPNLLKDLNLKSSMAVPRITKVSLNMGLGADAINDRKVLEGVMEELKLISGQQPVKTTARKSVAKIKGSGRTHAHKMQAAIAMSQRAKVASQRAKDPEKKKDLGQAHKAYQSYINKNKKSKD